MVARLNFVSHFVILFKCSKECVYIYKEEKKKAESVRSKNYFYICSSIFIQSILFSFVDTSRSVFKYIITILKIVQITSLKFRILFPPYLIISINPRAIEFKFFLPKYYELLHELVYFLRFAPSIPKLPGNNGCKLRKNFSACPLDEAPLPTLWKRIIVKGSTSVNSWGCTCKLSTTCLTWS